MTYKIYNFSIIAHIDHGKSTLSDRIIEICQAISAREMRDQILDDMELERERGITIKARTIRLSYVSTKNHKNYIFNLIDTPGHVDFSYEVSRSLKACEGVLLLVDATQGVEAQTLANANIAFDNDLFILPVINKIDLASSDLNKAKKQIIDMGIDEEPVLVSAKTGEGVAELLEEVVKRIPPAKINKPPLKALLIDSWYDKYLGIIILVRVFAGSIKRGDEIMFLSLQRKYQVDNVGYMNPEAKIKKILSSGEIGFFSCAMKTTKELLVGDTVCDAKYPDTEPMTGFKKSIPMVFCSIFPLDSSQFPLLQASLEKLALNDSSISFEKDNSASLGFGFRCGFLGLLHLDIVQERLAREFNIDVITTVPSVTYKIVTKDNKETLISGSEEFPNQLSNVKILEPWIVASIFVPVAYLGNVMTLCTEKRGKQISIRYIDNTVFVQYQLPLNEVIFDFYDKLKSRTKGYASFDYKFDDYREGSLVKVKILVNDQAIDALSFIVNKDKAEFMGRAVCKKLKDLIPRQLFKIPVQATVGSKIMARETISAMRKDVTAKCYGGDVTRKRKLLEKQKRGKKRMKSFGRVDIPQRVFIDVLKIND